MTGYLIHSHRYTTSEPTSKFWELQASIVTQLRLIRSISIVVAFVHPDHDRRAVSTGFAAKLRTDGWLLSNTPILYPSFGDSIAGSCRLLIGVHSNTEVKRNPITIKTPPTCTSWCIGQFLWAPFNRPEHAISYARDDPSLNKHDVNDSGLPPLCISDPTDGQLASSAAGVEIKYFVHLLDSNPSIVVSSAVVCSDGLSPSFAPDKNSNLFGHYFGIEFQHDGHTYIHGISSFEFASSHRLFDNLTYKLVRWS